MAQVPQVLSAIPSLANITVWTRSIRRLNSQTPMPLVRPTRSAVPPSTTHSEGCQRSSHRVIFWCRANPAIGDPHLLRLNRPRLR